MECELLLIAAYDLRDATKKETQRYKLPFQCTCFVRQAQTTLRIINTENEIECLLSDAIPFGKHMYSDTHTNSTVTTETLTTASHQIFTFSLFRHSIQIFCSLHFGVENNKSNNNYNTNNETAVVEKKRKEFL